MKVTQVVHNLLQDQGSKIRRHQSWVPSLQDIIGYKFQLAIIDIDKLLMEEKECKAVIEVQYK